MREREFLMCAEADGHPKNGKGPAVKVSLVFPCAILRTVSFQQSAGRLTPSGLMQAEKSSPVGTAIQGAKEASAAKESMPGIPKDEPSEFTKRTQTAKAVKSSKAGTDEKGSSEKTSKPKIRAAREVVVNGKADKAAGAARKERKVYDLPGQTRDTPPEVCFKPWP
jgi:hypothetical protein